MTEKFHIVYATDKGFLMPTKVSAASVIAHASQPNRLVIDVLDCGFDDADWDELVCTLNKAGPSEVCRHKIAMEKYSDFSGYHGSWGNYARFGIPKILENVDWCVYADGDTLFLGDVFELIKQCDDNYALLGHRDCGDQNRQIMYERFGWKGSVEHDCVCSGFMLMNLAWIRKHDSIKEIHRVLKAAVGLPFYDQDAINVVFQGAIGFLPYEWGTFNIESFDGRRIPKCVHYAFGKPWNLGVKWTRCLLDVDRLWFRAAKKYCGIGISAAGTTVGAYFKRWLRSVCHRIFLRFVCLTKRGRERWGRQKNYYSPIPLSRL